MATHQHRNEGVGTQGLSRDRLARAESSRPRAGRAPVRTRHERALLPTHFCRHCDHRVTPSRPGSALAFRAALIAASIGMVIMVLASSLIGPFIVGLLPFMALYGFALGPLHWLATMPATCTGCAREVIY